MVTRNKILRLPLGQQYCIRKLYLQLLVQREQLEVICLDRSVLKFGQVVKFEKGKADPKSAVIGHRAYLVSFGLVCLKLNYVC